MGVGKRESVCSAYPHPRFVRIHRQTIVNLDRVRELSPLAAGYIVVLDDGTQLTMSRRYRAHVERPLG